MTDSEKLLVTSSLLDGEYENEVIESALSAAGEKIINARFPFNNGEVTEVPESFHYMQCKIAVYLLNKQGAEGETSHSELGVSRSYESADIPDSMLSDIVPKAGVL